MLRNFLNATLNVFSFQQRRLLSQARGGVQCIVPLWSGNSTISSSWISTFRRDSCELLKPYPLPTIESVRTNVRNHFPRPSEIRRVKRHGLKKRLSTINGQKILMRRILKGRHVLAH